MPQVGAHGEIGDGSDHGDANGDVVKDAMRASFGEGVSDKSECGGQHQSTHGLDIDEHLLSDYSLRKGRMEMAYKVPVGAMGGDANVRDSPVDAVGEGMAVDDDGTIAHVCECFTKVAAIPRRRFDRMRLTVLGRRASQEVM